MPDRTIAMESTGVYWIPLFQVLERNGFEVRLVNASHAKNVPGRKTDVKDCQWLQQLHTFGMLRGSRLGAPTAINAGAHKLARLLYRMLKFGKAYVETGQQAYEKLFEERALRSLQRKARELGFDVTPIASTVLVS